MTINVKVSIESAPPGLALKVEQSNGNEPMVLAAGEYHTFCVHYANDLKLTEVAVEKPAAEAPAPVAGDAGAATAAETETAGMTGTD